MSSTPEIKELEFVQGMRRALDESAASLPSATTARLTAARKAALARKKAEPVLVRVPSLAAAGVGAGMAALPGAGGLPPRRRSALARFALAWPLAALVAGLFAIAYFEDQQRTAELADIDAAMLSDDLPLTAYLDHGFNAYLTRAH
ncbi:hypothetical protein F4827_003604 [Paraburkholderia bannensis]|jgi:hypothetical protein|uniref:DUF3619 family protein n=2 Tax=Burkholderiaceae TaxID=119060 RepID=A0A7W9TYY0_9BURK|nr:MULTISPECIES: DUF3619 family protein [Paraburkholderia]MBB3258735.1 hypothetical protein [Paraburkholderia sp. WP4_3_2]MBB6103749.1 hypothetical protein [Paraburkholderia bannensis]